MKQVKYVQFDVAAFLTDGDFLLMTDAQRGVYCSLIFYLYANGGKCRFVIKNLKHLCKSKNIEKIWEKIKNKFIKKDGCIKHKIVTEELRAAKNRLSNCRSINVPWQKTKI